MQKTVGVIGNGFVGNAIAKGFTKHVKVRIYDLDTSRSTHSFLDTVQSDFIFVCLPTPMISAEGGDCNLSILENFFKLADDVVTKGIFIIKSTVPIGTTKKINKKYPDMKIIHNPEFLTAANAEKDFVEADRHVLGGDKNLVKKATKLYKECFPDTPIFSMSSDESECVKYFANCFLAAKVMVFNEMKVLCDNIKDVDYDVIMEGVASDSRINHSHTYVPGPDGDYGFGGTCFPKDINALIHTMEKHGMNPLVLKSVWEQNKNYRNNWDWSDNTSAVLEQQQ